MAGPEMQALPDDLTRQLVGAIQEGIPVRSRPWQAVADALGIAEAAVIGQVRRWVADGTIKRFGLVVHHRRLGFKHNAMVVWDIPEDQAARVGAALMGYPFITLCYRRRRSLPAWPFNMYCMVHGTSRAMVLEQIGTLNREVGLQGVPSRVLFSRRCFKQRGARYA